MNFITLRPWVVSFSPAAFAHETALQNIEHFDLAQIPFLWSSFVYALVMGLMTWWWHAGIILLNVLGFLVSSATLSWWHRIGGLVQTAWGVSGCPWGNRNKTWRTNEALLTVLKRSKIKNTMELDLGSAALSILLGWHGCASHPSCVWLLHLGCAYGIWWCCLWPSGLVAKLAKVAAVILQLKNDIEDIIAGHGNLAYLGCLQ